MDARFVPKNEIVRAANRYPEVPLSQDVHGQIIARRRFGFDSGQEET
jgi:hypothetical protein